MVLAVEIGNTHISLGGFDGDDCKFVAPIATAPKRIGVEIAWELKGVFSLFGLQANQFHAAIVGSVVPTMTAAVIQALSLLGIEQVLSLSSGVRTGVNIKTEQPRKLGSDLVANAAWALSNALFPCVVVDLGTATTFTVLDQTGALIGTAICAGVDISLDALKRQTEQLTHVMLQTPKHGVLGHNTEEAIKAGAVFGTASMVDGMLLRYTEELGTQPHVLITGGAAEPIVPYLRTPHRLEPYLTLRGLHWIWKKNQA